jgi:flagellar biosynthesis/type III secretory pathway protein FliH
MTQPDKWDKIAGRIAWEEWKPSSYAMKVARALRDAEKAGMERASMRFREIYEEWAGSEGFIPQTCGEAYALELAKRMADIAIRAAKETKE